MSSQETPLRNDLGGDFDYNVSVARSMATRSSAALVPSSALAYHASPTDHGGLGSLAGADPLAFSRSYAPPTNPYSRTNHHQHAGHHGYYGSLASTPYAHYADAAATHTDAADYGYLAPAHHSVGVVQSTWGAAGPARRYDIYGLDASETAPHHHQTTSTASATTAYPPLAHRPAPARGHDASAFSFTRVAASLPSSTSTAGTSSSASLSSSASSTAAAGGDRATGPRSPSSTYDAVAGGGGYDAYGSAAAYAAAHAAARASTSTASSSGSSADAGYSMGGSGGGRTSLFSAADHYNLGHNGLESEGGYGYGGGSGGDDRGRGAVDAQANEYVPGLPAPLPLPSPAVSGRQLLPSAAPGEGVGGRGREGRSRR